MKKLLFLTGFIALLFSCQSKEEIYIEKGQDFMVEKSQEVGSGITVFLEEIDSISPITQEYIYKTHVLYYTSQANKFIELYSKTEAEKNIAKAQEYQEKAENADKKSIVGNQVFFVAELINVLNNEKKSTIWVLFFDNDGNVMEEESRLYMSILKG